VVRDDTGTFDFGSEIETDETFKTETFSRPYTSMFKGCLSHDVDQFNSRIYTFTVEQTSQKFLTLSEIHLDLPQFSTVK